MVDVCLLVEGSYPYVTGGVSEWVDGLVRAQPDVRFAVAHLRDGDGAAERPAYALPANATLHHVDLDPELTRPQAGAEAAVPEARVYHAACTGAAGELARRAVAARGGGLAVTEHGIAWREAGWGITGCKKRRPDFPAGCKKRTPSRPMAPLELEHHVREVMAMARDTYAAADAITSVCGPNLALQAAAGAPSERLRLIPNPVAPATGAGEEREGLLVGFVGRLVAIKDLETFLRAAALVAERRADARFVLVGPTEHEPAYAERMAELARGLGIGDRVELTGTTDPAPWYRRMDVLALTSLSEAQPLVALEAMAHGVPVVATDVGGCREAIGDAGILTAVRSPRATADAVLRIAQDARLRDALGAAGRRRAATTHAPERVHGAYRELYARLAA